MILFLYGDDTYRSRAKLRELREKFLAEVDPQGYNLSVFLGAESQAGKITDALMSAPFMARKRMVILEMASDLDGNDEEAFLQIVESALASETIFVVWEEGLDKKQLKHPLYKILQKSPYVMPFDLYSEAEIAGWMSKKFQDAGLEINAQALAYLSLSVGQDLWKAASETKKLIAYLKAQKASVCTPAMAQNLVSGGVKDDIFALVDAVSAGRRKQALQRLHSQIEAGSHELEIVSMLSRQYRLLQRIKDGLKKGLSPDAVAASEKIHPFVVKKMSSSARAISDDAIQAAYRQLLEVDVGIKSLGLSPTLLLSKATAELVQSAAK